jgi:hypothetical protein
MAHFIGYVQGAKGQASRLGTRSSGMSVTAASWEGSVHVTIEARTDGDYAVVELRPWQGQGTSRVLYNGPVSGQVFSKLHA